MSAVELESVTKIFRSRFPLFGLMNRSSAADKYALRDASLSVKAGEVLALMGPNGSGKTTLLKLIAGMLLADSGRILVRGEDVTRNTVNLRASVGFAVASERSFFPRLTARENLDYFAALENIGRAERPLVVQAALEQMDLLAAADTWAAKFSAGMWQRMGLARAILKRPSVLLLDEPTRSLDLKSADSFWRMVRQTADAGVTILMASHNVDEARTVGDRIAVLRGGSLVGMHAVGEISHDGIRELYFQDIGDPSGAAEIQRMPPRGAD